jgi:hypothetical protein
MGKELPVRRLMAIAASVAILLLTFAPAAFAADPSIRADRGLVLTVDGSVDVPAGQHVGAIIVVDGTATVAGSAEGLVVVGGTATLTGATVRDLVVVDGTVTLGAGTTITGDVQTLRGIVTRENGAVIAGRQLALEANLAAFALVMVPVLIVLAVGFALATLLGGLLLAAFGAKQTRDMEALISARPGHVLLAGIAGTIGLPILGGLLLVTIVGAPVGFALLFGGLPILAFVGWLVAAIWVGDWLLARGSGAREARHPYKAAILGVILLSFAGILPLVSGIATLFGVGALLLGAWRTVRPEPSPAAPVGWAQPMPSVG